MHISGIFDLIIQIMAIILAFSGNPALAKKIAVDPAGGIRMIQEKEWDETAESLSAKMALQWQNVPGDKPTSLKQSHVADWLNGLGKKNPEQYKKGKNKWRRKIKRVAKNMENKSQKVHGKQRLRQQAQSVSRRTKRPVARPGKGPQRFGKRDDEFAYAFENKGRENQMKLTKGKLKQIILEELEISEALTGAQTSAIEKAAAGFESSAGPARPVPKKKVVAKDGVKKKKELAVKQKFKSGKTAQAGAATFGKLRDVFDELKPGREEAKHIADVLDGLGITVSDFKTELQAVLGFLKELEKQ